MCARDVPSEQQSGTEGEVLEAITRSLVQLHKQHIGRGPTRGRTIFADNLVVCVLEGGFTSAEQTLRDAAEHELVRSQRSALNNALHDEFVSVVEAAVGRRVVSFVSGVDEQREITVETFILDAPPTTGAGSGG